MVVIRIGDYYFLLEGHRHAFLSMDPYPFPSSIYFIFFFYKKKRYGYIMVKNEASDTFCNQELFSLTCHPNCITAY
jgi:hypothetical protein